MSWFIQFAMYSKWVGNTIVGALNKPMSNTWIVIIGVLLTHWIVKIFSLAIFIAVFPFLTNFIFLILTDQNLYKVRQPAVVIIL